MNEGESAGSRAGESAKHSKLPSVPLLVFVQAAVSAASLVVEIVAGRMLAPYLGMSLYTWTSVIAVVLAGFSAGHWAGGLIAEAKPGRALRLTAWSMAGAALTAAGATFILRWSAGPVIGGFGHPIASITALTMLAFFPPSFFAGIPAPVLAHVAVAAKPERAGRALGAMFAASAIGAIAGTLAAGFFFISWLGSTGTLATVTVVYALLAALLFLAARRMGGPNAYASALAAAVLPFGVAAAALLQPDSCTRESDYFCIRVIDVADDMGEPARLMVLDHLGHGITVRDSPQRLGTPHAAILDILARMRAPGDGFSAFFIGGGSYSVPRAWRTSGVPAAITVAEIDPAVTEVAEKDFWFDPAGIDVRTMDARLALAADPARHDVIIGDAFTDIAVPAHLVTREFFGLVSARLTDDGVYLMNVVDHADGLRALAAITRTMRSVFPSVEIWAEPNPAGASERLVFIVLAGRSPSPVSAVTGPAPDFIRAARLSPGAVDSLVARLDPPILTDDYAPIDRLMTRFD
ncbi:MAG: spermidine synthase [Ahrensia sp.]|nr:spermidine synthase [Ahrensia sp.]